MNNRRALIVSLAVGLAAIAGVFALGRTLTLGSQARAGTDAQVSQRTAQLDRYEASLRTALVRKPPPLPTVPAHVAAAAQAAPPTRVVFRRPPPIVATQPSSTRHDEEHDDEHEDEHEHEEVEWDD